MSGGALLALSGLLAVVLFGRSVFLLGGFALAGFVLWVFGFRTMRAARDDVVRRTSPANGQLLQRSGNVAFWVLLSVILVDSTWQVLPIEQTRIAYVYAGTLAMLATVAYAEFVE